MAAFSYRALNPSGQTQTGIIEGDNLRHARQLLRDKGLIPLKVQAVLHNKSIFFNQKNLKRARLSIKELALVTRQLATLLSAGLPLEEALFALTDQTTHVSQKGILLSVRSRVIEGYSLANSLRDFPQAFSNLYCAAIAAGERSGQLDKILQRLADYTEKQYEVRQKSQHALIYPSIMLLVAILIVSFLLAFVVPKMIAVYSDTGQALPTVTRTLISLSNFIRQKGFYVIVFVVAIFYTLRHRQKKYPAFRKKIHGIGLRLPIIGALIKTLNTARFARTFSMLLSAGLPTLDAMAESTKLITAIPIQEAITAAIQTVQEGGSIHLALKQTQYFPAMTLHLVASGEASGQLEAMLERAALNQENEITHFITTGLALLEPAIICMMGAIVLFIVLAILLPLFQFDQLIT